MIDVEMDPIEGMQFFTRKYNEAVCRAANIGNKESVRRLYERGDDDSGELNVDLAREIVRGAREEMDKLNGYVAQACGCLDRAETLLEKAAEEKKGCRKKKVS